VGKGVPDGVVHTGMIKIAHRLSLPVEISGMIIIIDTFYIPLFSGLHKLTVLYQSSTFSTLSEKNIKDSTFNKVRNTCITTNDTYTQDKKFDVFSQNWVCIGR